MEALVLVGADGPSVPLPGRDVGVVSESPGFLAPNGLDPTAASARGTEGLRVSFEDLFRQRYDEMVRVAGLIVLSRSRAEEIVQDAFAKLYIRWNRIDNAPAYLRTTVVNLCKNEIRRREMIRRKAPKLRPVIDLTVEPGDEMFDALAKLPAKRRAALVLRYYADLSEQEIADVLGCRPGTVKSMVHRGLAQLREQLSEGGELR